MLPYVESGSIRKSPVTSQTQKLISIRTTANRRTFRSYMSHCGESFVEYA